MRGQTGDKGSQGRGSLGGRRSNDREPRGDAVLNWSRRHGCRARGGEIVRCISGEPGTPKYRPTSCPQVASGGVCARCLVNVSDLLKGVREPILGTRYCARMVRGVPVESLEYTEDVTGCQGRDEWCVCAFFRRLGTLRAWVVTRNRNDDDGRGTVGTHGSPREPNGTSVRLRLPRLRDSV